MRIKKISIGLTAAAIGLGLVACVPTFSSGSTLTTAALGPLVTLSWPQATEPDDNQEVATYRVDVNGVEVARVPAAQTSCVLTGLDPSTSYALSVTAYDTNNEWSGDDQTNGRVAATYVTPASGGAGAVKGCVATTDSDGDRLPDALERGTGTFVSAADPGTSATNADTDGDGVRDGDETLGTTSGLDLPGMGARAVKKDLLFEFDWFDDNAEPSVCGAHTHRPTAAMISQVSAAYANAPVSNPNGTTGINVIADYGQGGAFTGGNLIADADGVIAGGVGGSDFVADKNANFDPRRQGIFHYVLMPHRYGTNSTSSGQAEINGNDLVVSLYCYGSTGNVANTIVHETGHNLGLHHGGNVDTNYKPNYNSVMNYQYQFPGIDTDCTVPGNGVLDYSVGARAPLNENALVETDGICNGVDIDWNANGSIDAAPVAKDINQDSSLSTLTDFNDWANISLSSVTLGASPFQTSTEVVTEQPVPAYAQGH